MGWAQEGEIDISVDVHETSFPQMRVCDVKWHTNCLSGMAIRNCLVIKRFFKAIRGYHEVSFMGGDVGRCLLIVSVLQGFLDLTGRHEPVSTLRMPSDYDGCILRSE